MKITETIERECCSHEDRRPYKGPVIRDLPGSVPQPEFFCVNCGAWWVWEKARTTDPADSGEWRRWTP